MDETTNAPKPFSQASSHFPIEPLPASLLADLEQNRREKLLGRGNLMTGCRELDDYVLLGGFERGSVVGLSTEEEEMGLLIGLQTVAHLLASDGSARAMVVTTSPASVLLPKLRRALVGQLSAPRDGMRDSQKRLQGCLERISIARVFDIQGLWEVLGELEAAGSAMDSRPLRPDSEANERQESDEALLQGSTKDQKERRTVMDSEDEDGLSSPESSTEKPASPPDNRSNSPPNPPETSPSTHPDMVLITHASSLLNALFTGRDKEAAHNTMLLLSSHLHALTRSLAHGGPLIMFLNSTTTPSSFSSSGTHHPTDGNPTAPTVERQNHVEPTLRSIFSLPPPAVAGQQQYFPSTRRVKPSFGQVFSQLLDLHLLCTRVPRTRADNAALMARPYAEVSYVWVVEVLLDEVGVYERSAAGTEWRRRSCREQWWGAVDVDAEGRVVGASVP